MLEAWLAVLSCGASRCLQICLVDDLERPEGTTTGPVDHFHNGLFTFNFGGLTRK